MHLAIAASLQHPTPTKFEPAEEPVTVETPAKPPTRLKTTLGTCAIAEGAITQWSVLSSLFFCWYQINLFVKRRSLKSLAVQQTCMHSRSKEESVIKDLNNLVTSERLAREKRRAKAWLGRSDMTDWRNHFRVQRHDWRFHQEARRHRERSVATQAETRSQLRRRPPHQPARTLRAFQNNEQIEKKAAKIKK